MNGKLILLTLFIMNIIIKAQLSSFSENFDAFTTTGGNSLPQNGWNKYIVSSGGSAPLLSVKETGSGNKYIQAYSLFSANTPFYLISPQITAPSGNQTITVTTLRIGGTPGSGSLEVGLVASPSDLSGFTSLGNPIPIDTSTPTVTTLNVPASSYQYIAFKFLATANHQALFLDNIILTAGNLAVSDQQKKEDRIRMWVNAESTVLELITKKNLKKIQIYAASGRKVIENIRPKTKIDISTLSPGMYFTSIETDDGKTVTSKFVKK